MDGTPPLATVAADIEARFASAKASWDATQVLGAEIEAKAQAIQTEVDNTIATHQGYPVNTGFAVDKASLAIRASLPFHPHPDISMGKEFMDLTECGKITDTLGKDVIGNFCFEFVTTFAAQSI